MTAEVALLNANAVALAADSAVTIGSEKIYNSAVKLFELSKFQPVAAMIYGNAVFMTVPWETLLKQFRDQLHDKKFGTIEDYGKNLVAFLRKNVKFFPKKAQSDWMSDRVQTVFREVRRDAEERCEAAMDATNGTGIERSTIVRLFTEAVADRIAHFERAKKLDVPSSKVQGISKVIREQTTNHGGECFGLLFPVLKSKLLRLANLSFFRNIFLNGKSGLVVAGFGSDQLFPAIVTYEIDGGLQNYFRLEKS